MSAAGLGVSAVGIPWYRGVDYDELRRIMTDGDKLPDRHLDWLQKAEQLERQIKARGQRCYRAIIDPQTFPAWCEARGLNVNAEGRIAFANAVAASREMQDGRPVH